MHRTFRLVALGLIALLVGGLLPSGLVSLAATSTSFSMVPSTAAAGCLPDATAQSRSTRLVRFEIMDVSVDGLPANTDFDFFVIQVPNAPFGTLLVPGRHRDQREGPR